VTGSHQGKHVAALNGAVTVTLVVLLGSVALIVKPPAPPGIAEFAPRASRPITKAPASQGRPGVGAGACATEAACPASRRGSAPVPTPTVSGGGSRTGVPSALQCHAWPDGEVTQTFDPQSPPCIATWAQQASGNGGVTSPGVSATTIRVGVPGLKDRDDYQKSRLVDFFNSHYQLYGRRLELVDIALSPTDISSPGAQRAAAADASQRRLFAATELSSTTYGSAPSPDDETPYRAALAAKGIISVQSSTWGGGTSRDLAAHAPYLWNFAPPIDRVEEAFAEVACRSLVGKRAEWAGPASRTMRKFGFIYQMPSSSVPPPIKPVTDAIARCGGGNVQVERVVAYTAGSQQAVLSMRNAGVTTLMCPSHLSVCTGLMGDASRLAYQPEWVLFGGNFTKNSEQFSTSPDQAVRAFSMGTWDKRLVDKDAPSQQAQAEVHGQSSAAGELLDAYHALALIAAGVQLAGPSLTPRSFSDALHAASFPNPGAGHAPAYQATMAASDHVLAADLTIAWYSAERQEPGARAGAPPGSWCYLERGRRYLPGAWPKGPIRLFDDATCR